MTQQDHTLLSQHDIKFGANHWHTCAMLEMKVLFEALAAPSDSVILAGLTEAVPMKLLLGRGMAITVHAAHTCFAGVTSTLFEHLRVASNEEYMKDIVDTHTKIASNEEHVREMEDTDIKSESAGAMCPCAARFGCSLAM